VAGVLGAHNVSVLVSKLDSALHNKVKIDECMELARLCDCELMRLVQAIQALPEEVAQTENIDRNIDPEREKQIIAELENLLAEDNTRASILAREFPELLQAKLGSRYEDFTHQIDVFDYEGALETLCKE